MRQVAPTIQSFTVPAPVGGFNSIDVGSAMPPLDCIYLYNMLAGEHGQRTRLGYQEWALNLTGALGNEVRSMVPFVGSAANGSGNKLFAVTEAGIWDVSTASTTPTQLITFADQTGKAGFVTSHVCATIAGRFLLLCDEANGLYVYTETTASMAKVSAGTTQAWAASTAYIVGDDVVANSKVYTCTVAGTSSSTAPSHPSGTAVDGTVTWQYTSASSSSVIGPSLDDQQNAIQIDPAQFVFVTVWKSRVWLVERDTSRAWYLGVNSIYGTATSFDFGSKMRAGGPLVGLWEWSYDGGSGMDSLLVGISGAGDVVIYKGTDPTSADTFGLSGSWNVGGVVSGRKIATDIGGETLVASVLGAIPLSKLVVGASVEDESIYATRKISNVFNQLASTFKDYPGWGFHLHPTDNALVVTVPSQGPGQATTQLAFSFAKKSWSYYRDLPIYSACVWNGELYFGTTDGRVCVNRGYVDNVPLSGQLWAPDTAYTVGTRVVNGGNIYECDTGGTSAASGGPTGTSSGITDNTVVWDYVASAASFAAVDFSLLTAFSSLGTPRNKRVQMVRPTFLAGAPSVSFETTVRYGYNMLEPTEVSGNGGGGEGTWDAATWDSSVWGGEYTATQTLRGAVGMGREVAIAIRGNAISKTTLVGIDVHFDAGGLL